jgi:hypothetical protein
MSVPATDEAATMLFRDMMNTLSRVFASLKELTATNIHLRQTVTFILSKRLSQVYLKF